MFRFLLACCVVIAPMTQITEAGRIWRRVAANRESRGAIVIFPRLRAAAIRGSCSTSGSGSSCSTGGCDTTGACGPECEETEMAAARVGKPFVGLLRMMQERRDLTVSQRRALTRVLANPILQERVKKEVGRQFGVDVNNLADLLELFVQFAPQIIQIIMQIVSIFAGDDAVDCQGLTPDELASPDFSLRPEALASQ